MSTLKGVSQDVLNIKELTLTPQNILNGVTIFNVEGILRPVPDDFIYSKLNVERGLSSIPNGPRLAFCVSDVSELNCSELNSMSNFFNGCNLLRYVSLLSTENVTNLYGTFYNCTNLIGISNFNSSNVTNLYQTFYNCANLTTVPNIDTSNVNYMYSTFSGCSNLINVPNFNYSKIKSLQYVFSSCSNIIEINLSSLDSAINFINTFYYCTNLTNIIGLENLPYNQLSNISFNSSFAWCTNLVNFPNIDINYNANNLYFYSTFNNCYNLVNVPFNFKALIETSRTYTGLTNMFKDCHNLVSNMSNLTLDGLNNIYAALMFSNTRVQNVDDLRISNITVGNFSGMFSGKITEYESISNLLLYNLRANYMFMRLFENTSNLKSISNVTIENCINSTNVFSNGDNLSSVNGFSIINCNNVTSFLYGCPNLTTINNFMMKDSNIVTYMFGNCFNLVDVSNITIENCINIMGAFSNCYELVDVPEFNLASTKDARYMFNKCNNLSDASIQNIINSILNSNITSYKNLSNKYTYSIFNYTNIDNSRYANRKEELTAAGWTY